MPDPLITDLRSTKAWSRHTHTPINITTLADFIKGMPQEEVAAEQGYRTRNGKDTHGVFYPETNQIDVIVPPGATPLQLKRTIAHEAIHSALQGLDRNTLDNFYSGRPTPKTILGAPAQDPFFSFIQSGRGGDMLQEVPAYLGAFEPGYMKDLTLEDAGAWMKQMLKYLPKDRAPIVKKISDSYKAAREFHSQQGDQ